MKDVIVQAGINTIIILLVVGTLFGITLFRLGHIENALDQIRAQTRTVQP